MPLTAQQRRDYRDKRDLFRPASGSPGATLDDEGDPLTVQGAFLPVANESGIPCQFVTKSEFVESVGVAGQASVASRRFSKAIREEIGHDVRALDVIRLVDRGGKEGWYVVKGTPERHANDGSRRLNWQGYDLAPTIPLEREVVNGRWTGRWMGRF
jgi:hypothetical protein